MRKIIEVIKNFIERNTGGGKKTIKDIDISLIIHFNFNYHLRIKS